MSLPTVSTSATPRYYEIYVEGPPLLLLHGGLYGYVDEFSTQIPVLSQRFNYQ